MFSSRLVWFVAGAAAGVVLSHLLGREEGRALIKRALSQGFRLRDLLLGPLEHLQEELSDLVAEAREEHEAATVGPRAAQADVAP